MQCSASLGLIYARLVAWIVLLPWVLLSDCIWAEKDLTCAASSTVEFVTALADTACMAILIRGNGFKMSQADVVRMVANLYENRVPLSRNITIRGELPHTLWDLAFLKRRISLEDGIVVTLESLVIPNGRQPSATSAGSLDIFTMKPSSVVIMRNVSLIYPLCVPIVLAANYGATVTRPAGFQGTQSVRLGGPVCFPDVKYDPNCFNESLVLQQYAVAGGSLDTNGVRRDVGVILEYDVTFVCERVVTLECIQSGRSTIVCIREAVDRYNLGYWEHYDLPISAASLQSSSSSLPLLAIVLSCALGGLALLSVLAGVTLWWRRARRKRNDSVAPPVPSVQNGFVKTSDGMMVVAVDDRCGSALGQSPDTQRILLEVPSQCPPRSCAVTGASPWVGQPAPDNASVGDGDRKWVVKAYGSAAGNGSGPATIAAGQSTTLSLAQSGCTGAPTSSGGTELLLGNPLLAPSGPRGGSCSSGPPIALNMVLGVDVIASREAVVGRGTFATVLEGQLAGRPVAVKMFHRDAVGGAADDLKCLKQEIAILARCQHPNVVALLGAGSTSGGDEVFLVEELMVTNLARACHEGDGLPLHRVLAVARDVAAGLAYLHPTVIHRDLKPANVLLDHCGTAKMTDFGLSRLWASTVHTANPEAGTVQYMAPECFSGSLDNDVRGKTPISHQSDIYSFGVLLWEMLTRERPWRGLSSIQVALSVGFQHQRLKMPESESERFHPKLRKLIMQCWDADPRKRPGAAEIAKRLSLLLQHLQVHGSLSGTPVNGASISDSVCSDTPFGGSGAGAATPARPASSSSLGPGPGRGPAAGSDSPHAGHAGGALTCALPRRADS